MNNSGGAFVTFRVEQAAEWLVLRIGYDRPHTWRTLHLRDPEGRIRLSHLDCYNDRTVMIHQNPAYCSYLTVPGIVSAGQWTIEFAHAYDTMSETFSFEWEAGSGDFPSDIELPTQDRQFWTAAEEGVEHYRLHHYDWKECREDGPRWYKGDFHTHTVLSDGKMTPERNMEQAKAMGLDFFVATDHNLLSTSWPKGRVLVIPGMETTDDKGHWNALGLQQWIDWTLLAEDGGMGTQQGMNRLMEEAGRQGALRSINHPMLIPWAWMYEGTPLDLVDSIEIWNDPSYHSNPAATEKALVLWSTLWNEGCRMTGIGGSDSHMLPTESYGEGNPPSVIGDPATYVYADNLSAEAILTAVKQGRVYVSRGPVLAIRIAVEGCEYWPGCDLTEAVRASQDGRVHIRLTVSNIESGQVLAIENGEEVSAHPISADNQTFEYTLEWKDAEYVWRRFEIRAASGELLAFVNPVYSGVKDRTVATWGDLLRKASYDVPSNI